MGYRITELTLSAILPVKREYFLIMINQKLWICEFFKWMYGGEKALLCFRAICGGAYFFLCGYKNCWKMCEWVVWVKSC